MYGFILMAKGDMLEFYHQEEEVRDNWVKALKASVIILDLKEELVIGSLLGKGNFAKVHLCTRKN